MIWDLKPLHRRIHRRRHVRLARVAGADEDGQRLQVCQAFRYGPKFFTEMAGMTISVVAN
jgi:hypothetical protein